MRQLQQKDSKIADRKKKVRTLPTEVDDLRLIISQGEKQKIPPYEALKKAGYIKDALEFLA